MNFDDLNLIEPLLRAVREQGYTEPTPIQQQTIVPLLAGRDVLGCAQTGTGKTAAFALPILQRLDATQTPGPKKLRVLVLAPTRELALQISESFTAYGKYTKATATVIFGGVGQEPQVRAIRRGVDVLVATPGRLLDLMGQGHVRLGNVDTLVLDEADRMLDMGFVRDVKRILLTVPKDRQTLLFSATMPPEVQELADGMLRDPVKVAVTPQATTVEKIVQSLYYVERNDKKGLLEHLLADPAIARAIVFTRTKHGADKVMRNLEAAGVRAAAIHGNKSQSARQRALDNFKAGETRVLVATDLAARGIDVDGITHVINHDLPNIPESYVHRIGRTARAGADGIAISFCDHEEREFLRDIEKMIRCQVPVVANHPFKSALPASMPGQPFPHRAQQSQGRRDGGRDGERAGGRTGGGGSRSGGGRGGRPAETQRPAAPSRMPQPSARPQPQRAEGVRQDRPAPPRQPDASPQDRVTRDYW